MKKAIILHSLSDIKDCIRNKMYHDSLLFSTHPNVSSYLREYYSIECQCLDNFLTNQEVINYINMSSELVGQTLEALDSELAPSINRQLGLKMRYFVPLYSYLGKYHFVQYVRLKEQIKRIIEIYKLNKISFYNIQFTDFFDVNSDMDYLLSFFFPDLNHQALRLLSRRRLNYPKIVRLLDTIKRIKQKPFFMVKRMSNAIFNNVRYRKLSMNKKTILVCEPLYDLDFLKKSLSKYNILHWHHKNKNPSGFRLDNSINNLNIDFQNFNFIKEKDNPFVKIFLRDIKDDFTKNIAGWMKGINLLRKISENYPISLGIWGNSPMHRLRALIFEYLKSKNIKIIGAQHGSIYGDSFQPLHFDSDFNRCDYFISYGFTKEDLNRLYPESKLNCEIIPLGKKNLPKKRNKSKKKIDIVFPITMNSLIFGAGAKLRSAAIAKRQLVLFEYLNSLKDFNIYIKPIPFSDFKNCSLFPVIRRLKNLKVVYNMYLTEFLEKYNPRGALIEIPSTSLFELLGLDIEIFLMNNYLCPFEKQALEKLKKRVHYSEDINEIIKNLDFFLKGKLVEKRDQTFYNHYVYKKNTKENIVQLVDSLIGNQEVK